MPYRGSNSYAPFVTCNRPIKNINWNFIQRVEVPMSFKKLTAFYWVNYGKRSGLSKGIIHHTSIEPRNIHSSQFENKISILDDNTDLDADEFNDASDTLAKFNIDFVTDITRRVEQKNTNDTELDLIDFDDDRETDEFEPEEIEAIANMDCFEVDASSDSEDLSEIDTPPPQRRDRVQLSEVSPISIRNLFDFQDTNNSPHPQTSLSRLSKDPLPSTNNKITVCSSASPGIHFIEPPKYPKNLVDESNEIQSMLDDLGIEFIHIKPLERDGGSNSMMSSDGKFRGSRDRELKKLECSINYDSNKRKRSGAQKFSQ